MAYGVFDTTSSGWNLHYVVSLTGSGSQDTYKCRLQFKSLESFGSDNEGSGRPVEGKMFPRK